ncbi:hypothetical protein PZA11_001451 [Diplocarpon coronariae]
MVTFVFGPGASLVFLLYGRETYFTIKYTFQLPSADGARGQGTRCYLIIVRLEKYFSRSGLFDGDNSWIYLSSGVSRLSTIGARSTTFSFEPPSPVACLVATFLLSDECCETTLHFEEENFESRDVLPVDSPGRGADDFPLLLRDSVLVDGDPSGVISTTPFSSDIRLGRLLNWVRCTTVGSNWLLRTTAENFRLGAPSGDDESVIDALETMEGSQRDSDPKHRLLLATVSE